MKDCMNCINHSKDGCKVWKCDFKSIEDYKNEFAISVLEKIKEELNDIELVSANGNNPEMVFIITKNLAIQQINKYIMEIKMDNTMEQAWSDVAKERTDDKSRSN